LRACVLKDFFVFTKQASGDNQTSFLNSSCPLPVHL
jgi:hypothetical protein